MKILMIGVFNENSTNCSQARGFEKNNCTVIKYDYRKQAEKIGNLNRDNEIIKICNDQCPEMVFFSKCNEIDIKVVQECNKISKTILWYMDPLNCNFNQSLKDKIKIVHYTFCGLIIPYKEAKKLNQNNVFFLQEGFDEDTNYYIDTSYIHNVSFIGNLRNERKKYYDYFQFKIYNNSFNKNHSLAVSESRINLNFTEGGTSDRTYKILASKGFLLTQYWPEMEKDFTIQKDLDIFNGVDELKDKIDFYLKNEKERLKIAEHGYQTVQKFNRTNFAKKIIETIK